MRINRAQGALTIGLILGAMGGYSFGLSSGREEVQVASYNEGINDGIQYADDTAREGENCGVRLPYPGKGNP